MPDSISGLFGALVSDIKWSKLFLVPATHTHTGSGSCRRLYLDLISITFKTVVSHDSMTWNASCVCGVSLTQKLFGVGLRWLSHVQAHGFPCPRADLTHDGVVCDQVPLGNFRRCPGMVLSQRPVIKNIMFDSYSRYFLFIYFFLTGQGC